MTHKASNGARKSVQIGEQKVLRGEGGETHQISGGDVPPLTTQLLSKGTGCGRSEFPEDWLTRTNIVEDFHFHEKILHFDRFSLYCTYSLSSLGDVPSTDDLLQICAEHALTIPTEISL